MKRKQQLNDMGKKAKDGIIYPTTEELVRINKAVLGDKEALAELPESIRKEIEETNSKLKPRPVERIHEILQELEKLWMLVPDQRLGQLLENYVFTKGPRNESTCFLYYQEDTETLTAIKDTLKKAIAKS